MLEHLLPPRGACARALRERRRRLVAGLTPPARPPLRRAVEEGDPPPAEFRRRQARQLAPFVFRGAAKDWRSHATWSIEAFGRRFAADRVRLLSLDGLRHGTLGPEDEQTSVGELARRVAAGGGDYLRFAPLAAAHPELLEELDLAWLRARGGPEHRSPLQFFIGGGGTGTPLHCEVPGNFLIQVQGRKRLLLHPPQTLLYLDPAAARLPYFCTDADAEAAENPGFPLYAGADRLETTLEPGDVLWLPPFWWHHARNLTPANLAVGYRTAGLAQALRSSALLCALRGLARSPDGAAGPLALLRGQREIYPREAARAG